MTREEIISGLKFTIDMFMFDTSTGETLTEPRNDIDKTTIESCKGAIKELQDNSYELWKESYEVEHERNIRLEEKIKVLEQEPILDKIRAEIEQTTSRYCISRECGGSGRVEWSDRLIKESEVLQIIDKYKAESEDKK